MIYDHFASGHTYAKSNDYVGHYDEYVMLQYKAYKEICKRCNVKHPMTFEAWKESK